MKENIW